MVVVKNSGGLVLTRRAGETIVIPLANGERITITSGGTIKLRFEAPPGIKILRGELVENRQPAAA